MKEKSETKLIRVEKKIFPWLKRSLVYMVAVAMALSFVFTSCDKDDDDKDTQTATFNIAVSGLPQLDEFHVYEGWIVVNGSPVSTGTFAIDNIGSPSISSFSVNAGQLENASGFAISIEPSPDPDAAPSDSKILGGTFIGQTAILSTEHEMALGTGFSTAAGKFILATPTNGDNTDELSGVWWLNPDGPAASLLLPDLNEGWMYEGWVVFDGVPVSTGKFSKADMADESSTYSATLDAPEFPGEDFLTNAPTGLTFPTDLSGNTVVVSVEPEPDNSNDPFVIKPLQGDVPDSATDHVLYGMSNTADNISISGEVTR